MIVTNRALFEKKKEESMGNIYFRKEAEEWNQAFPVGNGFLGAMVFGNVAKERIPDPQRRSHNRAWFYPAPLQRPACSPVGTQLRTPCSPFPEGV